MEKDVVSFMLSAMLRNLNTLFYYLIFFVCFVWCATFIFGLQIKHKKPFNLHKHSHLIQVTVGALLLLVIFLLYRNVFNFHLI